MKPNEITIQSYKLDFDVWKEMMDVWKEREANHFVNVIGICRLGVFMQFRNYGTFKFEEGDEDSKWHPIVIEQESYNRKNSNCLIFNLDIDNCDYDRVFIYYHASKLKGHSGYYIYSSKDPSKHIHKYYMDNDMNRIILSLNSVIYGIDKKLGNDRKQL